RSQPLPCQDHALHVKIPERSRSIKVHSKSHLCLVCAYVLHLGLPALCHRNITIWPEMDPADANTIKTALNAQASWLNHHDAQLSDIVAGLKQLTDSQADLQVSVATKVNQLTDQMQSLISRLEGFIAASPSPPAAPAPPAAPPCCCCCASSAASGAIFRCLSPPFRSAWPHLRSFPVSPVSVVPFSYNVTCIFPWTQTPFASEQARVAFMVSHMTGRAAVLGYGGVVSGRPDVSRTGSVFCSGLKIQQGRRRVVDYALEFRTLAADSGWNETSIIGAFMDGLAEEVKDFLAHVGHPKGLRKPSRNSLSHRQSPPSPDTTCDPIPDHSDYPDLSKVPPCYYDLKEVFNKTKATSLPPHREWDCAIELLPGAPIPKARLYSLSGPEREGHGRIYHSVAEGQASSVPPPRVLLGQDSSSWAKVFTKLDLRNAYHLPITSPWTLPKWNAVTNWPPLTSKKKWNDKAEEAFNKLKQKFTTAPILKVPDPALQFVVEVDASNEGIGAVLSQRLPADNRIHPCAFLSCKLSAAERNYDKGNKELLAVKVALEEWRHWLEGAEQPFIVWTDHKNLEYLKSAKRLNSRQARWALFFSRFRFTLSYRPGSQNVKPDVLSRLYEPEPTAEEPETILSPDRVIGLVSWPIEKEVQRAGRGKTTPEDCPRNRLFVPEALRSQVIHWAHTSLLTCHPGVRRSLFFIQQRFWWPAMKKDVADYVAACSVCARGNTTVLTVVDRFSKMAHFIPLPKLPSAKETAQVMINHVFRIHGLPTDIVSDRGPQFVSVFWKEFCRLLGATVSLSSGYHPESNGQTERMNQELETCLRCLVAQNQTTWSQHLTWIEYAHNTLPTAATGLSPFHVVHGYQPPVFSACEQEVTVPSAHALVRRSHKIWEAARDMLQKGQARMKAAADRGHWPAPAYQPGQKVWLSTKDLTITRPFQKTGA
ncbi:hypothetical protein L3Q82_010108, partial [Scortum barcoo]